MWLVMHACGPCCNLFAVGGCWALWNPSIGAIIVFYYFFPSPFLTFHFHFYCLINRDFILIVFIFKWSLAAVFSVCFDSLLQNWASGSRWSLKLGVVSHVLEGTRSTLNQSRIQAAGSPFGCCCSVIYEVLAMLLGTFITVSHLSLMTASRNH